MPLLVDYTKRPASIAEPAPAAIAAAPATNSHASRVGRMSRTARIQKQKSQEDPATSKRGGAKPILRDRSVEELPKEIAVNNKKAMDDFSALGDSMSISASTANTRTSRSGRISRSERMALDTTLEKKQSNGEQDNDAASTADNNRFMSLPAMNGLTKKPSSSFRQEAFPAAYNPMQQKRSTDFRSTLGGGGGLAFQRCETSELVKEHRHRRPSILQEGALGGDRDEDEEEEEEFELQMSDSEEEEEEEGRGRDWSKPSQKTCDWSKPSTSKAMSAPAAAGRRGKMQRTNSLSSITESKDDGDEEEEDQEPLSMLKGSQSLSNLNYNAARSTRLGTLKSKGRVSFTLRRRRGAPRRAKSMDDSFSSMARFEKGLCNRMTQDASDMSHSGRGGRRRQAQSPLRSNSMPIVSEMADNVMAPSTSTSERARQRMKQMQDACGNNQLDDCSQQQRHQQFVSDQRRPQRFERRTASMSMVSNLEEDEDVPEELSSWNRDNSLSKKVSSRRLFSAMKQLNQSMSNLNTEDLNISMSRIKLSNMSQSFRINAGSESQRNLFAAPLDDSCSSGNGTDPTQALDSSPESSCHSKSGRGALSPSSGGRRTISRSQSGDSSSGGRRTISRPQSGDSSSMSESCRRGALAGKKATSERNLRLSMTPQAGHNLLQQRHQERESKSGTTWRNLRASTGSDDRNKKDASLFVTGSRIRKVASVRHLLGRAFVQHS